MLAYHDEIGKMSSADTYVRNVAEPDAWLRYDQWVARWIELAIDYVRLEIVDACNREIQIVPPPRYSWIGFYIPMAMLGEVSFNELPCFYVSKFLFAR